MTAVSRRTLSLALLANDGHIPKTAKALKLDPSTVRERVKKDPKLAALMAELDAVMVTDARGVVREAVAKGDVVTARWVLERRDPEFANSMRLKLTDAEIDGILSKLPPEVLAQLATEA